MIIFTNIEELKERYNNKVGGYILGGDVKIAFDLHTTRNIHAQKLTAQNISAPHIHAHKLNAENINVGTLIVLGDMNANDVIAEHLFVHGKLRFNAVCVAYKEFECESIKGNRKNAKYMCLDNEVIVRKKK